MTSTELNGLSIPEVYQTRQLSEKPTMAQKCEFEVSLPKTPEITPPPVSQSLALKQAQAVISIMGTGFVFVSLKLVIFRIIISNKK